jgi:hypothetical protein
VSWKLWLKSLEGGKNERIRRTWEDNIEVDLIKIRRFEMKSIHLECKAAVNTNELGFYKMRGITFLR